MESSPRGRSRRPLATLLALGLLMLSTAPASGQTIDLRYGLGFNLMATTSDGVGIGLRGRVAVPANSNLSIGIDMGLTGFVFNGRDNADYAFDPQLSLIVTLPGDDRAPYFLAGVGAYIPTTDSEGGPTIHFGFGRAQLIGETSVYYEIDPALVIESDNVQLNVPLRVGIIF